MVSSYDIYSKVIKYYLPLFFEIVHLVGSFWLEYILTDHTYKNGRDQEFFKKFIKIFQHLKMIIF